MRHFLTLVAIVTVALITACSGDENPESGPTPTPTLPSTPTTPSPSTSSSTPALPSTPAPDRNRPVATLPGGGHEVFPDHRLVGLSGGRSKAFGRLFIENLDTASAQLDRIADKYATDGKQVLPVFELITVIAHRTPGPDGLYRTREPDHVIQAYLDAARDHGALLLLNIQPGRAGFVDELRHLEPWLREPDVGVALDPEWAVSPGEVPGEVYGSTTGRELDAAAEYLSSLVSAHDLPEKVMVFHQVHTSVVREEGRLRRHPGVVPIKSVDGIGARSDKEDTWRTLMRRTTSDVHAGFKLFFDEDAERGPLMTPGQVLALTPTPVYVMYE